MNGIQDSRVTCSAAPVQIEGTLTDGRRFYFRARFGRAQLGIGPTVDAAVAAIFGGPGLCAERDLSHLGQYGASGLDHAEAQMLLAEMIEEALR